MNIKRPKASQGGHSGTRNRNRLRAWLLSHLQSLFYSLGQISRAPMGSFLTSAVIGISLALPVSLYLTLDNISEVGHSWDARPSISLFLKVEVDIPATENLAARLKQDAQIADVRIITPGEALEEYKQLSGFGEALDLIGSNPLPAVLVITPSLSSNKPDSLTKIVENLQRLPETDLARLDILWIQRLYAMLDIMKQGTLVLAILLSCAVLLIVGNTIKLGIHNQRSEIEIARLFGATRAFIRRPFLYIGVFYGLAGGILTWILVSICFWLLAEPVSRLASLYNSSFQLSYLAGESTFVLLLTAAGLGLLGSWLSVEWYLRKTDKL